MRVHKCLAFFLSELTKMENLKNFLLKIETKRMRIALIIQRLLMGAKKTEVYEQVEYTLTDINYSSHKNSFWGTKYVITESGNKFNNTYTDGEYYPTTSWGNQNFGMTIYNYLFTYSNWNIYAWN